MAKKPKLSLTKAVKYYRAGYPEDAMTTLERCKSHPVEGAALIEEVSAFVNADTLEEACKLAVKFDYGCDSGHDPNNWRSHVESISDIRRAAGHYEPDFSPEGIVKDLVTLVKRYNEGKEDLFVTDPLNFLGLADRIEMVYGRLWEESK